MWRGLEKETQEFGDSQTPAQSRQLGESSSWRERQLVLMEATFVVWLGFCPDWKRGK